ncbi:FISUMP domain-containing protein [Sunxiuqinia elliptica]
MKKKIFLFATLMFVLSNLIGQDVILTFNSADPVNSIDSIKAINIETGDIELVKGTNTINLSSSVTGMEVVPANYEAVAVYPNPFENHTVLEFYSSQRDVVGISLMDSYGRIVAKKEQNITSGNHKFNLSVANEGVYILSVSGNENKFSRKLISLKSNSASNRIEYNGYSSITPKEKSTKIAAGGLLFFYVYSGENITKIADSPTESKTYEVEFYECKDADGNSYPVIKIGTQWWMAENLKTTSYGNGDDIPNVIEDNEWRTLTTGAYCNYNNDDEFVDVYGRLYNWYAVNDSRKMAPEGWHIPSDEEWTILTNRLGGEFVAGGKLKEIGIAHWVSPNTDATDSIGFQGLPGGLRNPGWGNVSNPSSGGDFKSIGEEGHWHSSSEYDSRSIHRRFLRYDGSYIAKWDPYPKESGFSVRCIIDQ